jgi:hypothetical protein
MQMVSDRGTENALTYTALAAALGRRNSDSPPPLLHDAEDYPPSVTNLETWFTYVDSCRRYQECAVYLSASSLENAAQLLVDNLISHVMDPFFDATEEQVHLQYILYGYWSISL